MFSIILSLFGFCSFSYSEIDYRLFFLFYFLGKDFQYGIFYHHPKILHHALFYFSKQKKRTCYSLNYLNVSKIIFKKNKPNPNLFTITVHFFFPCGHLQQKPDMNGSVCSCASMCKFYIVTFYLKQCVSALCVCALFKLSFSCQLEEMIFLNDGRKEWD